MRRSVLLHAMPALVIGAVLSATPSLAQVPPDEFTEEADGGFIAVARGVVEPSGGLMRLAAQREGLIEEVMVEEGDVVGKGQVLARLNDTEALVQLAIAQTELEQSRTGERLARLRAEAAQAEAERLAPLAAADALPARQIDEARRAALVAVVELELAGQSVVLAQERLKVQQAAADAHVVRAPVDGVIVRRSARPGDGTSTSTVTELFLLAPAGPLVLRALLDEQFVGLVQAGQSAEILRERDDGTRLSGTVSRVAPVFASLAAAQPGQASRGDEARTVEISIRIDGPADQIARLVLGQPMIARIAP
jgi:multidrug resistance efflux pump